MRSVCCALAVGSLWILATLACCAQEPGLPVETVEAGSAAARAGILVGDSLLTYDGHVLPSPFALTATTDNAVDNAQVPLSLKRGAQTLTLRVASGKLGLVTRPQLSAPVLAAYKAGVAQGQNPTQEIVEWKAAAQAAAAGGDGAGAAWLWWRMGQLEQEGKRWQEARVSYETAWGLIKGSADAAAQCTLLYALGACCARLGDLAASRAFYEQSAQRAADAGFPAWEGAARTALGIQAYDQGDLNTAQKEYERALAVQEKLGADTLAVASSLLRLGNVAKTRGDLDEAQKDYEHALAIQEKQSPDSLAVAALLNNLGTIAKTRGDLDEAQHYYERALVIREKQSPDSLDVAASLNNLGLVAEDRGDLDKAQDYLLRALAIKEKQSPDSLAVASSLNNLGTVAKARGDLDTAQHYYERALAIQEKQSPDSLVVAGILDNLGLVAKARGDLDTAQHYYERALAIQEKRAPDSLGVVSSLNNLGIVAKARGNLDKAQNDYERALAIQEKRAPDSLDVAELLDNLGNVAVARGDPNKAQHYDERALAIQEKRAPNSLDTAASLNNLGNVTGDLGDVDKAQGYLRRALTIQEKQSPDSLDVTDSLNNMGTLLIRQKRPLDALPLLVQAVTIIEKQRGRLENPEARALLTNQYTDKYDALINAYLDLNQYQNAFAILERKRARALMDEIAEHNIDFSADAPPELLAKQRDLDNQRRIAYRQRSRLDPDRDKDKFAANDALLTALTVQQRQLTDQIRRQSRRYAALVYPQPLDLQQVQTTLDPGTLLLEYAVGQDQTLLFAVTTNSFALYRLPLKQADLAQQVKQWREMLAQPASLADYRPLARQLYADLLRPAQARIEAAQRLLICPDGPLQVLPFCALIETPPSGSKQHERFLLEARPLHTVVAMNVYSQLKQQPAGTAPGILLALGDPVYAQPRAAASTQALGRSLAPLPMTAEQVKTIAALFAPHVLVDLGKAATRTNVFNASAKARILHFACHGVLDDHDPLASALALTPEGVGDDGMLRSYDILGKLHLHADLVVLSGCETGLGVEQKNEGLEGLTRAFEYAGAKSVAVSLWELADTSSTALMEAFYRELKAGKAKDEALRQAQLTLLHGKQADWREPFHWAAFQLVGDWK